MTTEIQLLASQIDVLISENKGLIEAIRSMEKRMNDLQKRDRYLSVKQTMALLEKSRSTIDNYVKKGLLTPSRYDSTGHPQYLESEIIKLKYR